MRVISYNLLKHRAASELEKLIEKTKPDALCLQEAKVDLLPKSLGELNPEKHGSLRITI